MHRETEYEDFVECGSDHPEACDCGASSHVGGYKCPVCGQNWKGLPPEDWDGTILCKKEGTVQGTTDAHREAALDA
jgi:hypothetical protein